jgi:hypothetical protein
MKENLLKLPNVRKYINGNWLDTQYAIDEDKLDNIIIIRTNDLEVNIKDYIRMIALEVIEEVLTKMEDDKNDGEKQNLS